MFQHLNQFDQWPRVRCFGMEVDAGTGALTLRKLPGPPRQIAYVPGSSTDVIMPAGIAVGANGEIFVSDAVKRRVVRIEPHSGATRPLDCVTDAASTERPMGLAFQACRDRLLIADAANSRIQVVDPHQSRVVAVWGQTWRHEPPTPCGKFGGLDGPEHLACDRAGNAFVIDRLGNEDARIVKLDRDGNLRDEVPQSDFDPVHITVGHARLRPDDDLRECLLVLAIEKTTDVLCLLAFDANLKSIRSPMRLLGPDVATPAAVPSTVLYGFMASQNATRATGLRQLRGLVSAFTVIGTTAVVGLATTTPRVWCFEIGAALTDEDAAVEPSWLPRYDGAACALGVRGKPHCPGDSAELLLFAGSGRALVSFAHRGVFRTQGAFLAGPFAGNRDQITHWHRLRFDGQLSENGRVQWFTLSRSEKAFGWSAPVRLRSERLPSWFRVETQPDLFAQLGFAMSAETDDAPESDEFAPLRRRGEFSSSHSASPDRTPPGQWFAAPENQLDGLLRNAGGMMKDAADQLWIFALIAGDELTSPMFTQARLEHDEDGWLADLPEVYHRTPVARAFMRSLLALLESRFEDVTAVVDRLPALFSPHAVSAQFGRLSCEMDWLRGTLALSAAPRLSDRKRDRKRNIQSFVDGPYWLARRGTREGLRRLLWLATGVDIVIDEPGLDAIPDVLGIPDSAATPTGIASSQVGVGSSNILGYSALPDPGDAPARLRDDLAHHFVVRGYESDLIDRELRELVEETLRRLSPAHTTYSLQMIGPRARVGVQARLGVDAVLARCQPADPLTLDEAHGPDAQIEPSLLPPTVGDAHLGKHSPLM